MHMFSGNADKALVRKTTSAVSATTAVVDKGDNQFTEVQHSDGKVCYHLSYYW